MAYATVAQVQAHIPTSLCDLDGTGTQPVTEAVAAAWLDAASAWIDGTLRWKYGVPVTDAGDLLVLAQVAALMVAGQVWDVIGGHSAQEPANGVSLKRTAYQLLAYQERGANAGRSMIMLPGTALADSGEAAIAQAVSTFTDPDAVSDDDTTIIPRFFSTDMEF